MPIVALSFNADDSCVIASAFDGSHWLWPIAQSDASWLPIRQRAPVISTALNSRYLAWAGADRRVVTFVQRFGEGAVRKELTLAREGELWRIVAERTLEVR